MNKPAHSSQLTAHPIGLKLWSTNTDAYIEEAKRLYKEGWFDYIELYVVPETTDTIKKWSVLKDEFNIPFTLHAPHFVHGVNLAVPDKEGFNIDKFKEVEYFFNELDAKYVVVHPGIGGTIKETIRQLKNINNLAFSFTNNLLIENKPYLAPLFPDKKCRGATIEEIKMVIDEIGCGFCLDVGHAICTYKTLGTVHSSQLTAHNAYEFLARFNKFNPTCYHLSDNFVDNDMDRHWHFGNGNYDIKKIFGIIDLNKNIAIETNKDNKDNLDDFIADVKYLREIHV